MAIDDRTTNLNLALPNATNRLDEDVVRLRSALNDIDSKVAPLASPSITGTPTAPTPAVGNSSTRLATTAFVGGEIGALVGAAPANLNTLVELAAAINNDPNYYSTVNSALSGKQPLDGELTALASVTSAANKLAYFTGSGTATVTDLTAFGRSLIDDADAATARVTLSLGNVDNTSDANKPISTATQTALNAKQPLDAELTALAGLTSAANKLPYFTGSGAATLTDISAFGRSLIDDADAATARSTLQIVMQLPFYNASGSSDPIALTSNSQLPFYKASGSASSIPLTLV